MNKFTKGAIATGAAIVLLLGGAGTFALWNDSASVAGGSITSGVLKFDTTYNGQRAWLDSSTDVIGSTSSSWATILPLAATHPIADISTFRTVPGDRIALVESVKILATGNNLVASFGYTAAGASLPGGATVQTIVLDSTGTPVAGPVTVHNNDTFTVIVAFSFSSSVTGTNLQNTAFPFGNVAATVTQVRP